MAFGKPSQLSVDCKSVHFLKGLLDIAVDFLKNKKFIKISPI